ncbi:MAG: outer membrane protein assembly factor BamD, partial [Elioraea sp.]|nr:outer membrane protein assembly factor BamD [Elioraea sp.]
MSKVLSWSLLLAALALLPACALFRDEDRLDNAPVEELYALAKRSLDRGNYARAEEDYKRLIARFPFGPYSEQAQLELAYAQHKMRKAEEALSTINRFIRTYPRHEKIAYAHYLRALISFERELSFIDRWLGRPPWTRDLEHLRQAFSDFGEVIQ